MPKNSEAAKIMFEVLDELEKHGAKLTAPFSEQPEMIRALWKELAPKLLELCNYMEPWEQKCLQGFITEMRQESFSD